MTNVIATIQKQVPSVPQALKALVAMEKEMSSATTYIRIRDIIREASALKVLLGHIADVKAQAEDTILIANRRIGEEIEKVPKATHKGGPKKQSTPPGKSLGRGSLSLPGTSRARLLKLAGASLSEIKKAAKGLREHGKDATVKAVVTQITQGDKKERRATREQELGIKQKTMPQRTYGVVYADPPWRFVPFSKDTGMDRAADNHYPTMDVTEIAKLAIPAAPDCVLFLWATVPMLPEALSVMRDWDFTYKSHFVWVKDKPGTGFWALNQHELLLIGTRGKVPAPAPGEQYQSAITAPRGQHSAKPFAFREMIETMFPTLPRIELFAREMFAGWDAWGNEAPREAAE